MLKAHAFSMDGRQVLLQAGFCEPATGAAPNAVG